MKKVLFTLLRSKNDCIKSSHLISAYKANNPHTEAYILTYKKFEEYAGLIDGITSVYSIDSEAIHTFMNNEIYSDSLGLNTFSEELEPIVTTDWDEVVNLSNDSVSAYICSGLESKLIIGAHIGNFGSVVTNNTWSTYLNSVTSKETNTTIGLIDVKSHMIGSPLTNATDRIKLNEEFTMSANNNFAKIRNLKPSPSAKIVGISLTDGRNNEYIDDNSLSQLIESFESSGDYKVVLISSGNPYEVETVNKLNKDFNDTLITINADLTALPSVLVNLDVLIACSNTMVSIAEALDVFTIELTAEAKNPILEKEGHYIIECKENFVQDILFLASQRLNSVLPVETMSTENPIYETVRDEYGSMKTLVRGPIDINKELTYHLKRCYNYSLLGYPVNNELLRNLQENISREDLNKYIEASKEEITIYVKTLLTGLRSLKTTKENGQNSDTFIKCLDQLIQGGNDQTLPSGALGLLEGRIENITSTDKDENINQIEKYLFEVKSDLQMLTNIFSDLLFKNKGTSKNKEA